MTAVIRLAMPDDAAPVLALRRKLFAESNTMLWEPQEFVASADDERARIERMTASTNGTYLVACHETEIVGLLFATGGAVNRLRRATTLALGVAREHQGRGIATRLVQAALAWSKQAGLRRVDLTVHADHLRAVGVYLRCGFRVEGLRRSSLLVDGRYVDEYLMSVVHDPEPRLSEDSA